MSSTPTIIERRFVASTNGVPHGRVGIYSGCERLATVADGPAVITGIDRALRRHGWTRTTAFRPLSGLAGALAFEAAQVQA